VWFWQDELRIKIGDQLDDYLRPLVAFFRRHRFTNPEIVANMLPVVHSEDTRMRIAISPERWATILTREYLDSDECKDGPEVLAAIDADIELALSEQGFGKRDIVNPHTALALSKVPDFVKHTTLDDYEKLVSGATRYADPPSRRGIRRFRAPAPGDIAGTISRAPATYARASPRLGRA